MLMKLFIAEGAFMAILRSWGFETIEEFAFMQRPPEGPHQRSMAPLHERDWCKWNARENLLQHNRGLRRVVQFYRRQRRNRVELIAKQVKRIIDLSSRGGWFVRPEGPYRPEAPIRLGSMRVDHAAGAVVAKGCRLRPDGDKVSEIFVFQTVMSGKPMTLPVPMVDGFTLSENRQLKANVRWHARLRTTFNHSLKGRKYETRSKRQRPKGCVKPISQVELMLISLNRQRINGTLVDQNKKPPIVDVVGDMKLRLAFRIDELKGVAELFGRNEICVYFSVEKQLFAFSHKPEFNDGDPDRSTMACQLDEWADKMINHFGYMEGFWRLTTGKAGTRLRRLDDDAVERVMADINRAKKN